MPDKTKCGTTLHTLCFPLAASMQAREGRAGHIRARGRTIAAIEACPADLAGAARGKGRLREVQAPHLVQLVEPVRRVVLVQKLPHVCDMAVVDLVDNVVFVVPDHNVPCHPA